MGLGNCMEAVAVMVVIEVLANINRELSRTRKIRNRLVNITKVVIIYTRTAQYQTQTSNNTVTQNQSPPS